jgi:dTDP-4-dehydrorhamnose 3,5-epimerase
MSAIIEKLSIPGVMLVTPRRFADARGWFSETWNAALLGQQGFTERFVQDSQSFSAKRGTIRGLHCQAAPNVQGKLVRAVRGAVWDVAVDIRHGSPSFGRHIAATLSAQNGAQLWIPGGFLHGFVTLEPDTEVAYKVTAPYGRSTERGVIWNDPDLALPWPADPVEIVLSDKDAALPRLAECEPGSRWSLPDGTPLDHGFRATRNRAREADGAGDLGEPHSSGMKAPITTLAMA